MRALICILCMTLSARMTIATDRTTYRVGVAKVDITPDYPIRLSGFHGRNAESDGIAQRLYARALAIGSDEEGVALLMAVDNTGVPDELIDELAGRLEKKGDIARERLTVCSTHTHTGPCLKNMLPNMFGMPIPPEHQKQIDRYTHELTDLLENAARAAIADRKPAYLAHAEGKVEFARNRRTKGGPVDHSLPLLRIIDGEGKLRATVTNYACHCTTLDGNFIRLCGDWAGYAAEEIEREHEGAVALVTIGCGADADPYPRAELVLAQQHGKAIAGEVESLLKSEPRSISGKLSCRFKAFDLPFDRLPTREQWQEKIKRGAAAEYHARLNLERLDRGEALPTKLGYSVQTWTFGDELAMVFLPGEVVVDYPLRLKKEFDAKRLWVTAYANDVPCYIPSKRILNEGGYEAEDAMAYYDRPTRLAPEVESLIIKAVHELLPESFVSGAGR